MLPDMFKGSANSTLLGGRQRRMAAPYTMQAPDTLNLHGLIPAAWATIPDAFQRMLRPLLSAAQAAHCVAVQQPD
jgi:hypothetical protein